MNFHFRMLHHWFEVSRQQRCHSTCGECCGLSEGVPSKQRLLVLCLFSNQQHDGKLGVKELGVLYELFSANNFFSVQRSAFWQTPTNREVRPLINVVSGVRNIAMSLTTKVTQGYLGGLAAGFGQGCVCSGDFIHLPLGHTTRKQRQIKRSYKVLAGERALQGTTI